MQSKTNIDEMLADSFKVLALKMPIDKITIKEITDGAGVIRPTFYNHFRDKYELLEWMIHREILEPVIPLMQRGQVKESLIRIFDNLLKDKKFYKKVVRLEGQHSCESIARQFIKEMLYTFIDEQTSEKKLAKRGLTTSLMAEYYAQSMAFVVIQWIKMDMSIMPEEMADLFEYITTHSMDEVIVEMK